MASRRKLEKRLRQWFRFYARRNWAEYESASRGFVDAYNRVAAAHNRRVNRRAWEQLEREEEWAALHDHED